MRENQSAISYENFGSIFENSHISPSRVSFSIIKILIYTLCTWGGKVVVSFPVRVCCSCERHITINEHYASESIKLGLVKEA